LTTLEHYFNLSKHRVIGPRTSHATLSHRYTSENIRGYDSWRSCTRHWVCTVLQSFT